MHIHASVYTKVVLISPLTKPGFMFIFLLELPLIHGLKTTCKQKDITEILYIFITTTLQSIKQTRHPLLYVYIIKQK